MVSASFQVQHIDSLWSNAQIIIGFGTVACVCCALFLGLKLKWFRAQFKVQDLPKTKKSSDNVQGIGFKIKSNSDDFQHYKSISEFATPDVNLPNIPNNKNQSNNGNNSGVPKKATIMNTSAKAENSNKVILSENINKNDKETISVSTKKNVVLEETSTREIQSQKSEKETEMKTSIEKNSKVSFVKNKAVQQNNVSSTSEQVEENIVRQQIRNPLSAQNIVMPQEDEDSWHIKVVAEKPKVQIDNRNDNSYYEEIHLANNHNSNSMISNSMYSSQAASIFFGGSYDEKQPPDSPPPPIPRKFLEDEDTLSLNSQTSA